MRLWTLHPRYLDTKGLVALWREALLAQKVLQGKTKGYRHHPQLIRFQSHPRPEAAIATYLAVVFQEAKRREYIFNEGKISKTCTRGKIEETRGQVQFEWSHLKRKLRKRDHSRFVQFKSIKLPKTNPVFRIIPGDVQNWEVRR
jgi:hypothetical protein